MIDKSIEDMMSPRRFDREDINPNLIKDSISGFSINPSKKGYAWWDVALPSINCGNIERCDNGTINVYMEAPADTIVDATADCIDTVLLYRHSTWKRPNEDASVYNHRADICDVYENDVYMGTVSFIYQLEKTYEEKEHSIDRASRIDEFLNINAIGFEQDVETDVPADPEFGF